MSSKKKPAKAKQPKQTEKSKQVDSGLAALDLWLQGASTPNVGLKAKSSGVFSKLGSYTKW